MGTERESFATLQRVKIFFRYRKKITVQTLHFIAVQTRGAVKQARGIEHVRSTALVDVHVERGILADQCAGGAGVVQVNVS